MRTGRAVTVGAVLVAIWVLKLILLTVVLAARAALAQLDDLHMLDGGVIAVLAAKFAAGAAGLSVSRGRSVLFALTARSVALASLDPLDVLHLELVLELDRELDGVDQGDPLEIPHVLTLTCARTHSSIDQITAER